MKKYGGAVTADVKKKPALARVDTMTIFTLHNLTSFAMTVIDVNPKTNIFSAVINAEYPDIGSNEAMKWFITDTFAYRNPYYIDKVNPHHYRIMTNSLKMVPELKNTYICSYWLVHASLSEVRRTSEQGFETLANYTQHHLNYEYIGERIEEDTPYTKIDQMRMEKIHLAHEFYNMKKRNIQLSDVEILRALKSRRVFLASEYYRKKFE